MTFIDSNGPKIYYANNNTVPPEKRGKEISDEDYERISQQKLGSIKALKAPKASTLRKMKNTFEEWLIKYMEKPHRYNVDTIEKNANTVLDIIDTTKKVMPQSNSQSMQINDKPQNINIAV